LFVFNHDGSKVSGFPKSINGFSTGVPAVEDIDNDGKKEILLSNFYYLHVFKNNGEYKEGFPQLIGYTSSTPAVGDINNDGKKEIIVGTGMPTSSWYGGEGKIYVFNSSGGILWSQALGDNYRVAGSSPVLGDIDGDGKEEIVHGATRGYHISRVYAWNDDGTLVSGFPVDLQNDITKSDTLSKVVLADADNDGKKEIFVVSYQKKIYGIKGDGSFLWQPKIYSYDLSYSNLLLADVDNNGKEELVFASHWRKDIYALNLDGTNVAGWPKLSPVDVYSLNIEDINYDNIKDILIAYSGKTYVLEQNMNIIDGWPKGGGGFSPAQISDIDNDNNIEIAVPSAGIGLYDFLVYEQKRQPSGGTENNFIETTECKIIEGYDFVNDDENPMDDNGHGTHCAGIAAGSGKGGLKGIAYDAKLYAYKVLDYSGSGYMSTLILGIERAVDPNNDTNFDDKVDVISISLGGGGNPDDAASQAVDTAVDDGVVVVIAAGNEGPSSQTIGSPGTARKAITVGATYKKDYGYMEWYRRDVLYCTDNDAKKDSIVCWSSRGPVVWTNASGTFTINKPDIVAPGAVICSSQYDSAWNDRKCFDDKHVQISGTSMATPHVAGAAALLKQKNPGWSPEEIKTALKNTAKDLGYDINTQGAGRIDILKAVALETIFELKLHSGWNLVSVPLIPENANREAVFPSSNVTAVWQYNNPGGYQVPETIQPKIGYWIKVNKELNLTINGTRPADDTISVNSGWNLIGVVGNQNYPSESWIEAIWEYLPPYNVPSSLFERRGFWIKASQAGTLFTSQQLSSAKYYEAKQEGVCGNNIREGLEQCDGSDDFDCENNCLQDCKCGSTPSIPIQKISCIDSDNGLNYYVKGNIKKCSAGTCSTSTSDSCIDKKTLKEYYCNNTEIKSISYSCPKRCSKGMCAK